MKIRFWAAMSFAGSIALACPAAALADCPNVLNMRLSVDKYRLVLNDKRPICVTVPGEFRIRIHTPPGSDVIVGKGDVTARGKHDEEQIPPSATMKGDNNVNSKFLVVKVNGMAEIDQEFDLWIHVAGVGTLDPTVRVIGNQQRAVLTYEFAQEALGQLGVAPELITEMLRPLQPQQQAE